MPCPMVHLAVAYELTQIMSIDDKPMFYLGSISPDAIHMREGTTREDKDITHLRGTGEDRKNWDLFYSNVKDFILNHRQTKNSSFFLGYATHVLTDIYWIETLYATFMKRYSEDISPLESKSSAYYNDIDKLDFELYKSCGFRKDLWNILEQTKGIDVDNILSANEVDMWNKRTLHWYDSGESEHKNPIKYISSEELKGFIKDAANHINLLI